GRLDDCIAFVEQTRRARAPSSALLIILGDAQLKKGEAVKAEESYRQALDAQGDNADALLGLAQVAQVKADANNAALYLRRAKDFVGNSPELLYKYAQIASNSNLDRKSVV